MRWYAMVMPPMANRCSAAVRADVKAARTRLPTPIGRLAATRSCTCIKNVAVRAACHARLAPLSHARVELDPKKAAHPPPLSTTLVAPDPDGSASTTLETYPLWSFALQK